MLEEKRMKRVNEKWVDCMKDRLEQYAEPVPVGGWEALEKELAPVASTPSVKWKRMAWAAVVAWALLSLVGAWMLQLSDEEVVKQVASYSESIHDLPQTTEVEVVMPKPEQPVLAQTDKPQRRVASSAEKHQPGIVDSSEQKETAETLSNSEEDKSLADNEQCVQEETVTEKTFSKRTAGRSRSYASTASVGLKKTKNTKWSIAMGYGNSLGQRGNSFPGYSTLDLASYSPVKEPLQGNITHSGNMPHRAPLLGVDAGADGEFPQTEVTHKTPVTVGFSFRYNINRQFAVETGLDYTLLSSELRAGTNQTYYVESYKFHYLGIPLKASWTFLDIPYLSLYLTAGGELEKSLAGKYKKMYVGKDEEVTTWNDNVKPVQWSVLGGLGVQLKLSQDLGIYAEPGVVYYFDDGSMVQTIRKEKPFNFKIQLGVRWTY